MILSFRVQPTAVVAGAPIQPAVAVNASAGSEQTVTLSVADSRCGAQLSGQVSRRTTGGVATFPGIALDVPATGYRLEGRTAEQSTRSDDFEVIAPEIPGPLVQHGSVCVQGYGSGDAASLAWDSRDDLLWTTDDNLNRVCGLDRRTGACVSRVTQDEIHQSFPGSSDCDDGDGDPATGCSFTEEFETLAWDRDARRLYVFNTVNDPDDPNGRDRPAVFRFRSGSCRGCLEADGWNALPDDFTYRAAVVIGGEVYISNGRELHAYDFASNVVSEQPLPLRFSSIVTGLSFDSDKLSAVTLARTLQIADWERGLIEASYDLSPIGALDPSGLSIVRDTFHVLEGRPGLPIFRLTIFDETP